MKSGKDLDWALIVAITPCSSRLATGTASLPSLMLSAPHSPAPKRLEQSASAGAVLHAFTWARARQASPKLMPSPLHTPRSSRQVTLRWLNVQVCTCAANTTTCSPRRSKKPARKCVTVAEKKMASSAGELITSSRTCIPTERCRLTQSVCSSVL